MVNMRGWSFPIGRFLGVDVRIHTFFLLLLGLSISYASMTGATGGRGFALWLLLLLAVFVREIARALGAAWFGLDLRSVLLLPLGGLMSYATTAPIPKDVANQERIKAIKDPTAKYMEYLRITSKPQIDDVVIPIPPRSQSWRRR